MKDRIITAEGIQTFARALQAEERLPGTREKYLRDLRAFAAWLGEAPVTRERASAWKESLIRRGFAPVTVNSMAAAINKFFTFAGWPECRVKALRIQRRPFREENRQLTRQEYDRLLSTACRQGRTRLALLLEAICATGIRVSEVRYITVEAARQGSAEISLKGKIRVILLPARLRQKLLRYAEKEKIASGEIFLTRSGKSVSRKQIWAEMKSLCAGAGVAEGKVFPHNLRHLFARTFYRACRDVVRLADVLGHSSVETTRIYLAATSAEHARTLNRLGLIC